MESLLLTKRKFTWTGCLICSSFTLFLLAIIALGSTVLASTGLVSRAAHRSQVITEIREWNATASAFENWTVSVQVVGAAPTVLPIDRSPDAHRKGGKIPPHRHLRYAANTTLTLPYSALRNDTSDSIPTAYNLTAEVVLNYTYNSTSESRVFEVVLFQKTLAPIDQRLCAERNESVWQDGSCMQHYYIKELCFVVQWETKEPRLQECGEGSESWRLYRWSEPTPPPSLSFPECFSLRCSRDPLLLSASTDSHAESLLIGCILILVGGLFLVLPGVYVWQVCRRRERLLLKQDVEMSSIRESYAPRI